MKEFLGNIDEYLEFRQKRSIGEISAEKAKLVESENKTQEVGEKTEGKKKRKKENIIIPKRNSLARNKNKSFQQNKKD